MKHGRLTTNTLLLNLLTKCGELINQCKAKYGNKVNYLFALLSGVFGVLAFAPFNFWPAYAISICSSIWFIKQADTLKTAFRSGLALGLGFFGAGISWVYVSIATYGQIGWLLSVLITLAFVAVLASFYALAFSLTWKLITRFQHWPISLVFTVSLLLSEYLRSTLFTGFPWLLPGYSLHTTWAFELSPIGGIWLLTSLAILTFSFPVAAFFEGLKKQSLLGITILLAWGTSLYLHNTPIEFSQEIGKLKTTLIQGNIKQDEKWLPENAGPTLDYYQAASLEHLDSDLIVWPETAITYLHHQVAPFLAPFDKVLKESNTSLITGVPVFTQSPDKDIGQGSFYNGLWTFGDGFGLYLKQKLVPFGEYIPFQDLLGPVFDIFGQPMTSFQKGEINQPSLQIGEWAISSFICYEIVYPDLVRNMVRDSDILLTVSNDGWFGESIGPLQHLQIAQFRAKESSRYLIRATNTGVTAIMDEKGNIIKQLPQFTRSSLTADVKLLKGITPYVTYGNLIVLSFLFSLIALYLLYYLIKAKD
ncbi:MULTISPECIES: apolipoprotein N-acyltransferase [unclassified Marinomonas]|uniref:apolipoprotein N-acyltransferase n=1 Tax=unclassified Marinomonas TaxID=196814 RepID=UPI0009ECDB33|nr:MULTISPECIES: apolipoprotein N-acyltransferase [unclassified Marinomonas]